MSLVKKIELNVVNKVLQVKFFRTQIGYYFKIYHDKKQIAQMYYYSSTLEKAGEALDEMIETLDMVRINLL